MIRRVLTRTAAVAILNGTTAKTEQVSVDSVTGDAKIRYLINGEEYSVAVPSADRISPRLTLTDLVFHGNTGVYTYRHEDEAKVPAVAGRGILTARVTCPGNARTLSVGLTQPRTWRLAVFPGVAGWAECQFEAGLAGILEPGTGADGLQIRALAWPGTADAEVLGVSGGGAVSSGEETPDTVYRIVDWAQGRGWTVRTVTTSRLPSQLTTPQQTLAALNSDLMLSCDSLAWITDHGTCQSLVAKVNAARPSLEHGHIQFVRSQLSAFRAELDAQQECTLPKTHTSSSVPSQSVRWDGWGRKRARLPWK